MKIHSFLTLNVILPVFIAVNSWVTAATINYEFAPGNLEGWTQIAIPGATSENYSFFATNSSFINRISWQDPGGNVGGVIVTNASDTDRRDDSHQTAVLRSPSFILNGVNPGADVTIPITEISFSLLGGHGKNSGSPSAFVSLLPDSTATDSGASGAGAYLGMALRRVDGDGTYLLYAHRSGEGQKGNWESITWDANTLAAAISGDAPGTLYTLDLIDAAHGSWGWIAMDNAIFTLIPEPQTALLGGLGLCLILLRRRPV